MNYGLYLSASGVLTNMHRQDVIANNLANASTVGFKRDLAAFTQRLPESQEDPTDPSLAHDLLDRLGGGMFVRPSETDLRPGQLELTGNDLDLALAGRGFFAVRAEHHGEQVTQLTRDGRLTLDTAGRLITTVGANPVLDRAGQPIRLDPTAPVHVDEAGAIHQRGAAVAQLKLVDVADAQTLEHRGNGLYSAPAAAIEADRQAPARVRQGAVEGANVQPVQEMVSMIEANRAISQNATLIRYHDRIMDHAVNTLGRIA